MKSMIRGLNRPMDKVLYRPIALQNERQQAARGLLIDQRRLASSIRPEKRNGALRHR